MVVWKHCYPWLAVAWVCFFTTWQGCLQNQEVEALTSSTSGSFLELEPGVTPAIDTWGGATMVNDVEASVRDALEKRGTCLRGGGGQQDYLQHLGCGSTQQCYF